MTLNHPMLSKCRPVTATLLKPQILDPSWSLNIDMTEIKLSSLTQIEALLTKPKKVSSHVSIDTLIRFKKKVVALNEQKQNPPRALNNERSPKIAAMDFLDQEMVSQVPSPCRTCTKNNEPERFHSHPRTATKIKNLSKEEIPPRNTVSKPVPLKFKSGKSLGEPAASEAASKEKKSPKCSLKLTEIKTTSTKSISNTKITSTCSKCGSQIFTNRLPAHERICRGKSDQGHNNITETIPMKTAYEENHLFCKRCGKTFGTDEEKLRAHLDECIVSWNGFDCTLDEGDDSDNGPWDKNTQDEKYEMYKQQLKPCPICKRKFFPNRIETHEAACRKVHQGRRKN